MYNIKDYLQRGLLFANNLFFPSRKKISTLMLYTTSLCDSRCKHCMVWNKRPVAHIPKEQIFRIMESKCISKNTSVGLEGGEFLLHPESMEILKWFSENHPNFDLLSNCLKPDKLINAVKTYPPRRLYLSLDGNKETYQYMRGRDGHDSVIKVIEECKDIVPISLMFTLSPYNSFSDAEYVVNIAKKYGIDVRIGIYNNIDFFDTQDKAHQENNSASGGIASGFKQKIPANVADTSENIDFLYLYDEWKNGRLKLRCNSIFDSLVIHPNGDIPVCQNLELKLGNVYDQSLDEIFNSRKTQKIQNEQSRNCNKCWVNFHRKYDIVLLRTLETFFPKRLIELFYGKYQWTSDTRMTYKEFSRIVKTHFIPGI